MPVRERTRIDKLRWVAVQGLILTGGFGFAQLLGFARNAMLGHLLAKSDFGVAAAITITLQIFEMISDTAADRMIVQAKDGDDPKLLACAHTIFLMRALMLAALVLWSAPYAAELFLVPEAVDGFRVLALVPLIKGLVHLDWRRAQRRLDNRAAVLIETVAQAAALALTWPAVWLTTGYEAVLWIAAIQGVFMVGASHCLAESRYRLSFDGAILWRFVAFGWPILLGAIPVLAVFQGDRIIVARFLGLDAFAGYTAAFLLAMVPVTLAIKIGHSLMLPLLAQTRDKGTSRHARFSLMCEMTALMAAVYLALFATLGGEAVLIAFGPNFAGTEMITAAIALMWAVRMAQMPAQALFLAEGDTRPLLVAGLIRCSGLALALAVAFHGADLLLIALSGTAGELLSLIYLAGRAGRIAPGLGGILISRSSFLLLAAAITLPMWPRQALGLSVLQSAGFAALMLLFVAAAAAFLMPSTRGELKALAGHWRERADALPGPV